MGANVDQGVNRLGPAKPEVEGHIGVTGGTAQIVILVGTKFDNAPLGLQGDQNLAPPCRGEAKCSFAASRIAIWRAPGSGQFLSQALGQSFQSRQIIGDRPTETLLRQSLFQRLTGSGIVSTGLQVRQHRFSRSQGIKPDRVSHPIGLAGISRKNHGEPFSRRRISRQPRPTRDPVCCGLDPLAFSPVDNAGIFQFRVPLFRFLERNDPREDTPIHFRQHHVHGEVGG